jgi:hypothetical protein
LPANGEQSERFAAGYLASAASTRSRRSSLWLLTSSAAVRLITVNGTSVV